MVSCECECEVNGVDYIPIMVESEHFAWCLLSVWPVAARSNARMVYYVRT